MIQIQIDQEVMHPTFGKGFVTSFDTRRAIILFETGFKQLVVNHAKLVDSLSNPVMIMSDRMPDYLKVRMLPTQIELAKQQILNAKKPYQDFIRIDSKGSTYIETILRQLIFGNVTDTEAHDLADFCIRTKQL